MDIEFYKEQRQKLEDKIKKTERAIEMWDAKFIEENSPFQIGDKVLFLGKVGYVNKIEIYSFGFEYYLNIVTKKGYPSTRHTSAWGEQLTKIKEE